MITIFTNKKAPDAPRISIPNDRSTIASAEDPRALEVVSGAVVVLFGSKMGVVCESEAEAVEVGEGEMREGLSCSRV